ncbi:MAG: hypothetical protein ACD_39C01114G0001 [uncultured bacterium]|nr:MAG: hypothetical protein ACD_39C01114G0001 [uncultured bacterium]
MGAVEMYNMDKNVMMTYYTENEMNLLIEGKYLKSPIVPAEKDCCIGTVGDLSQDGTVICSIHGSPENPISEGDAPQESKDLISQAVFYDSSTNSLVPGTVSRVEVRYEGETWFTRIWNSWLADVINLLINVPLFIIGLFFSLYLFYVIITLPFKIIAGIVEFFKGKES